MVEPNLLQNDGRQPPKNFRSRLKYLGPGLIISGAIVGSGELIATTALGAKVGFVARWLILFLDDDRHPDARLGNHDGSRTVASLYDLIKAGNKTAKPSANGTRRESSLTNSMSSLG